MSLSSTFSPNSNTYSFIYRFIDLCIILISLPLAASLYGVSFDAQYLTAALVVMMLFLYGAESLDLYRSWRSSRFTHMVLVGLGCITAAFLITLSLAFLFKVSEDFSRVTFALWFAFTLVFNALWRVCQRYVIKMVRISGYNVKNIAIIGATESGEVLLAEIQKNTSLGYNVVGIYDDRKSSREQVSLPVVGGIEDAIQKAQSGELDVLFIALPVKAEARINDILLRLGNTTVDVHFVPNFLVSNLVHARIAHVGDIDTLSLFDSPYHGTKRWLKRTEDLVLSFFILLLISVPLLIIALGVKLTSKGPVIFKQRRYGLCGEEISVWKFRSMTVCENGGTVTQATKNDVRITPFGRFLRRTSLDELPQFFNVFGGDMSIVGPRPHAVSHNEEYREKVQFYMMRHKVKPGITGWAQINGWRGETDTLIKMEKRVEHDLHYIKTWSVWLDFKIILLTVFKGFVNKNAY